MSRSFLLLTCLAACALSSPLRLQAQFDELSKRIPIGANSLFVADLQKITGSDQAQREKWSMTLASLYGSGLTSIPPNTTHLIVASELDFEFMHPLWEVAIMDTFSAPPMQQVAKAQGGKFEQIAGLNAVAFESDAYLVQFGKQSFGSISPANRQRTSRWVRNSLMRGQPQLSPYLREAMGYVNKGSAGAVIAIDLLDVVSEEEVMQRLAESEAPFIKGKNLDTKAIGKVLASLRGLMLGATFADVTHASLRVDFGVDAAPLKGIGKPLLIKLLGDHGVMIDDIETWASDIKGKQLLLSGTLTTSGRRRLLSLIDVPAAPTTLQAKGAKPKDPQVGAASTKAEGYISAEYFHAIQSLLDDLRDHKRESKTIGLIGVWLDKYARKIDRLPINGVDEDLVEYSQFVSSRLRDASMAIKGIGINSRVRELAEAGEGVTGTVIGGYGYGGSPYRYGRYGRYGWYGGTYTRGMDAYERKQVSNRVRAEERAKGATSAVAILQDIENVSSKVRGAMAKKYKVEF